MEARSDSSPLPNRPRMGERSVRRIRRGHRRLRTDLHDHGVCGPDGQNRLRPRLHGGVFRGKRIRRLGNDRLELYDRRGRHAGTFSRRTSRRCKRAHCRPARRQTRHSIRATRGFHHRRSFHRHSRRRRSGKPHRPRPQQPRAQQPKLGCPRRPQPMRELMGLQRTTRRHTHEQHPPFSERGPDLALRTGDGTCARRYNRGDSFPKSQAAPHIGHSLGLRHLRSLYSRSASYNRSRTIHDGLLRGFGSRNQYNLIPFVNGADPTQLLLNAALFVPFGCFFGTALGRRAPHDFLAKKRARACKRTAMSLAKTAAGSFAFSLVIETSQLLNNRTFDIDDLVMNTLGGCIGFAIALVAARLMQGSALRRHTVRTALQQNRNCASARPRRNGVTIAFSGIAAAAFLGRFVLFNELTAAGMLYGF